MNDDFERRIKHQPLRRIPGEWRAGILVAADVNRRESVRAFTSAATIRLRLREIFWPAPAAWAGLAAVWIFIFTVNFSMRDKTPVVAEKVMPPSPEMVAELRRQNLLFAELIGPAEAHVADRPKSFVPRPRSECAEILAA
jgi:hypothetical protein